MFFVADFHIHSKFSRATSKQADLEHLHVAAQTKGVSLVGTGDFTHPAWFQELKQKLEPAEPGLFQLSRHIRTQWDQTVPASCRRSPRFMLTCEISCIYKKHQHTRKNHHLVTFSSLDAVQRFSRKLSKIGNIESDGRPILGLDARNLLEIVLETDASGCLIPAHIWTPWFSVLGSKSGFDSLQACFDDLTPHIFAVETGLSSDPPMNWRISALDGLTLVSNSDAHSPRKIGREANLFNTTLSYFDVMAALKSGHADKFLGTIEFYPEEGKYHLDGHRKCGLSLWPQQSLKLNGNCPVCLKPLTLGVLNRVECLADRPAETTPDGRHSYFHLIPLDEILADIYGVGPATQKVSRIYRQLVERFGPEFEILHQIDPDELCRAGYGFESEAIGRVRRNQLQIDPGYDGEYGKITIFTPAEKRMRIGQKRLFATAAACAGPPVRPAACKNRVEPTAASITPGDAPGLSTPESDFLNPDQKRAVYHRSGPVMVVAGPGTGKTLTLSHRIKHLIDGLGRSAEEILAITFTVKAAHEMRKRLRSMWGYHAAMPMVTTFHGFCFALLQDWTDVATRTVIDEDQQQFFLNQAWQLFKSENPDSKQPPQPVFAWVERAKQQLKTPPEVFAESAEGASARMAAEVYRHYQQFLDQQALWDYEDLIMTVVRRLESDAGQRAACRQRFSDVLIDEYQDLNQGQYRLVKCMTPPQGGLFAIGDPNQAIYGFRGADVRYFEQFCDDFPEAATIHLRQNYRSTRTILDASCQVISARTQTSSTETKIFSEIDGHRKLTVIQTATDKTEAVIVGRIIETFVGGLGFHSVDFGRLDDPQDAGQFSFSDIAVLVRTRAQTDLLATVFRAAGIPYQVSHKNRYLDLPYVKEILSLLRMSGGCGTYKDVHDLANRLEFVRPKPPISEFVRWGMCQGYSLQQAITQAKRFPLPGMSTRRQSLLVGFFNHIHELLPERHRNPLPAEIMHLYEQLRALYRLEGDIPEGVAWLAESAGRFSSDSNGFLAEMALKTDADLCLPQVEMVSLLTMHAAKGLEFPVVFICGCEQGLLPFQKKHRKTRQIEEERRLFYVALTRAKRHLFLTHAKKRRLFDQPVSRQPSPFIRDIESRLLSHQSWFHSRRKGPATPVQRNLF